MCVLISAYLWSFGIAVSLQTLAASVSLVSQLWLLNEGVHQVPRGLPLPVSQPGNSPGRQVGQSQGSFHLFPLRDHCPSLAENMSWKHSIKMKTPSESVVPCFVFVCFLVLGGRITLVLIHVGWIISKLTTWIIMPGSSPCTPLSRIWATFYSCYPVDTALEMSLKYTLLSMLC